MRRISLIPVFILYCFSGVLFTVKAQELFADRYNFTYITMNEGLESNSIKDLFKDSRGFLWVASAGGGLSRYDGYDFVHYNTNSPGYKLKSNFIETVCQDSFSRLWVTSEGGTDIIDLLTHRTALPADPTGKLSSLMNKPALRAICDTKGGIWIFCQPTLFNIELNEKGDIAKIRTLPMVITPGANIAMTDIDQDGCIWLGAGNEIYKITFDGDSALKANPVAQHINIETGTHISTLLAKENEVWIATDMGLFRYDRNGNVVKHYQHSSGNNRSLSQNYLTDLAVTANKQLIISTLKGINIYNPISDDFELITYSQTENKKLLNSNFVNRLLTDGNRIWLGTETGGINKMEPRKLLFHDYVCDRDRPASISCNPVNAIFETPDGALWVGTVEGGLNRKDKNSESFTHYTSGTTPRLSHNSVSALTMDNKNRLWVGTWGGGIDLLDLKVPYRVVNRISSQSAGNFPVNFIGTLIYDSINTGIWIGANNGIYFYDLQLERMFSLLGDDTSERILGCVGSVIDKKGQLWIGSMEGIYIIDLHSRLSGENRFSYRHLRYKLDQPQSRIIEKITCFCQADDGTLWLGSNGYGIYKCTTGEDGKEQFIAYTTENGLPNNSIRGILQDKDGSLWISTNYGISCYNPSNNRFSNYTIEDGLIDNQFYWNASCRSVTGVLFFGGVSGLTAIEGKREDINRKPVVRLTRLKVENKEIEPISNYISEDISSCRLLRLHERDKSFSIEFSALNFNSRETAVYSYRLLGFNNSWVNVPASRRFANYMNLPPGTYTFQVKYIADGLTGEAPVTELQIKVEPFFYKTTWFILLLVAAALLGAWQLYQWRIRSLKHQREALHQTIQERTRELTEQKQLLENQTAELSRQNTILTQQNEKINRQKTQLMQMARKVQEATVDKLSFFTNITHEFRTPITLITGPIERALKLSYNPQVIEQLHFVERNSKYLLSLINQLMDFRKIESGKMNLSKTQGDFLSFVDSLITPFHAFAGERNITIRQYYRLHSPSFLFDEDAMHKVITNLLSNAVKFTPNRGKVSLYIAALHRPESGKEELYICVSDTGSGIAEDDIPRIFNRFYQSHKNVKYPAYGQTGTGIGLYLCKRIVQMHGGQINVKNNRGAGCSFRLFLPLQRSEELSSIEPSTKISQNIKDSFTSSASSKLTLLIVEDNADMRGYIRSILTQKYNLLEAADGQEALALLKTHAVDFIVSDLMMPVMDGIELSRRVKENFAISHIPFLMLTAKTSSEAQLESYRMGVDEYILKPFDETLLLARIENILENRRRYQQKFSLEMNVDVLPMDEESSDKKFLNRIMEVVKQNYKNSYFDISDFTEAMGISKSLLNKKMQNISGQSAGQFIRNYRLNIARELILKNRETKNLNISEVAYEVGFNDPKYFTRCFTKHFNITPSGLLEGGDKNHFILKH